MHKYITVVPMMLVMHVLAQVSGAECVLINADQEKMDALTVQEWSLDGVFSATKADGQLVVMPTRSIFLLRQNVQATEPPKTVSASHVPWVLLLRQGDVLVGKPRALKDNSIEFESRALGVVDVPLNAAALLTRRGVSAPMQPQPATRDTLRLKNGDKVEGLLAAIDGKQIQVQSDLGMTSIELERVERLVFAGVPTPTSEQLMARLMLVDGSQITTNKLKWMLNEITLNDPAGSERKIAAKEIAGVDILGGNASALVDLPPTENVHQAYLGPVRTAKMNRNSAGGPLMIAGVKYERGIGMQAASKVVYKINGAFSKLNCMVGLDDSADPMGRASVSIWADGKQIMKQELLRPGEPPTKISLNISDVSTLELRADLVNNLDVQARVNWIDPVLRRP